MTRAINNKDQTEATNEKFILEEAQRKSARERKAKCEEWIPALFEQDPITGEWHYRYAEWVQKYHRDKSKLMWLLHIYCLKQTEVKPMSEADTNWFMISSEYVTVLLANYRMEASLTW